MKNFMVFLILIIVLATFLAITNPNQEDFISWGVEQLQEDSETDLGKILEGVIGEQVLRVKTSRTNYVIFSIFSVENSGESAKYLGIVNQFFRLGNN
ncbi:MAG: DUF4359 domain-containing protein [Halanaerobiales bacterium]|nr:DUF4359 domain-containing protein [Halanaerobiales bacterium]